MSIENKYLIICYMIIAIYYFIDNCRFYIKLHYKIKKKIFKLIITSLLWPVTLILRENRYKEITINDSEKFDFMIESIFKEYKDK